MPPMVPSNNPGRIINSGNVKTRASHAALLAVVKINPAVRFYERLGFQITHEDDRKFYMKRDPNVPVHISN
jgi:ribosomal protein S18 acetylase RimI-like enzyme